MSRSMFPRCNGDTCVLCRHKFQPGDRVQIVHILEKVGTDPSNPKQAGAWLSEEFEFRHVNCTDTGLEGVIVVRAL